MDTQSLAAGSSGRSPIRKHESEKYSMTCAELYLIAVDAFNPGGKGPIIGYPVEVLYNVGRLADAQGWEQQVLYIENER